MIKGLMPLSTIKGLMVNRNRQAGACVACLDSNSVDGLCHACRSDLPINRWCCRLCCLPLATQSQELTCGDCLKAPPPYERSRIPWRYQYPIDGMISRYKYSGQRKFARPLIQDMCGYLKEQLDGYERGHPDLLVPAPMHPAKRRKRGFNQARDIAEHLSRTLGIPLDTNLVYRTRHTPAQQGLNRAQRLANLADVFAVKGKVPERVAIVDDVVTTGATARLLASRLKEAGALDVEVWALARTPA